MRDLVKCIENLQTQLERHRHTGLKEYPTRTIFFDPMLNAMVGPFSVNADRAQVHTTP